MGAVTHPRLIHGTATPEAAWQAWLKTDGIATVSLQEWLQTNVRLVVIAPHPDDEVLACGGLMSMHRAQCGEILVIAVTDGEASHGTSSRQQASSLAQTRRAERNAGLQRLGLHETCVTRLATPDGQVAQHTLRLARQLQSLLRPRDLVVTTWRFDGHPDHEATGLAASLACLTVGCRLIEAPVWMWHWATPGDLFVPWHRLQRLPLMPQASNCKRLALAAHASQLDPLTRPEGPVLGPAIVARANWSDEYFFIDQAHDHATHAQLL